MTSWLLTKVEGTNAASMVLWRLTVWASSKRFRSAMLCQMPCHNSYWVSESIVEAATIPAWSP